MGRLALEIRKMPDPVLRKKAKRVLRVGPATRKLLAQMADTMYEAKGVGLAAPQVGISKRLVVIDVGEGLLELVNPEITSARGKAVATEGCLSIPGLVGDVTRWEEVTVKALDSSGNTIWLDGKELLARALQHEIDHLEGVLFVDKAVNLRPAGESVDGDEA